MGPLYVEALQSSVDANEPELAGMSQDAQNESWRTLCVMSHTWMGHGTQMDESCHTHECSPIIC